MANLTYTFTQLQNAVTHALGRTPDSRQSAAIIVNRALNWLTLKRLWRWRKRTFSGDFVADTDYVLLPTDFDALHTLKGAASSFRVCTPVDLEVLMEYRQFGFSGSGDLFYAVGYLPQTSATLEPAPVLFIYPQPSASAAAALAGVYLRRIPTLVLAAAIPDIPGQFHDLLMVLCRAMATATEDEQLGPDWALFNQMLPDYEAADAAAAGWSPGKMRNTVGSSGGGGYSPFDPQGRILA